MVKIVAKSLIPPVRLSGFYHEVKRYGKNCSKIVDSARQTEWFLP